MWKCFWFSGTGLGLLEMFWVFEGWLGFLGVLWFSGSVLGFLEVGWVFLEVFSVFWMFFVSWNCFAFAESVSLFSDSVLLF